MKMAGNANTIQYKKLKAIKNKKKLKLQSVTFPFEKNRRLFFIYAS